MKKYRLVFDIIYFYCRIDHVSLLPYKMAIPYETLIDEEDVKKTSTTIDKLIKECDPVVILHGFNIRPIINGDIEYLNYHFEDVDVEAPWERAASIFNKIEAGKNDLSECKLTGTRIHFTINKRLGSALIDVEIVAVESVHQSRTCGAFPIMIKSDKELVLILSQILEPQMVGWCNECFSGITFSILVAPEYVDYDNITKVMHDEIKGFQTIVNINYPIYGQDIPKQDPPLRNIIDTIKFMIHQCGQED